MDGWMIGGYCIVCVIYISLFVMGPREIFGPRAPQSLNPALILDFVIPKRHILG